MTSKRIDKVRQEISLKSLDGIYVNNITNVRYLTGFSGSAGSLLILENDSHFFTHVAYFGFSAVWPGPDPLYLSVLYRPT